MARFEEVEIFLRVVERGSFIAAAHQLDLPAATVSRKIKSLEERLGVELLHRTTRRVSVTEAGRGYYERCSEAIVALDEADTMARSLTQEPAGLLRVLSAHAFGLFVVEPTLADFRRRYPKVRLSMVLDDIGLDLVEQGFDIAIRVGPIDDSSDVVRLLRRSPLHLVASPAYLDRRGRPAHPADLAEHDLVNVAIEGPHSWPLRAGEDTFDVRAAPILQTNNLVLGVRQTAAGTGIALMPVLPIAERIAKGELEIVLPAWRGATDMEIVAVFRKRSALDLKVRAFLDHLVTIEEPGVAIGR